MKSTYAPKLAALVGTVAWYGSVLAAAIFGVAFATGTNAGYHVSQMLAGKEPTAHLPVFVGLISACLAGGFLAANRRLTTAGIALSFASLAAVFAWSEATLKLSLSPFLVVLAVPGVLQLVARQLERIPAAAEEEAAEQEEQPVAVPAVGAA